VLELAEQEKYFAASDLKEVRAFLENPAEWSAAHGGIGAEKAAV
jgi:orotate phosphoribosyltransferase